MKELELKNIEVVVLFLQKLEKLTDEERKTLIKTIQLINNPMFISN